MSADGDVYDPYSHIEFAPGMPTVDPAPAWLEDAATLLGEDDPGPTPYLIDRLIVAGGIAMIVGPAKARKTWTLLELAVSVVTGRPAFGEFIVPDPGPVIVVLEESGRAALHRRLSALARGRAIVREELDGLWFAANRGVRLDDREWQQRLVDRAVDIGPRAVFLDPLVRMKHGGRSENDQTDMAVVLDYMRYLREHTEAAVVFAHHTGHTGEHARGTSDIEGYWESRLKVAPDKAKALTRVDAAHREDEEPPAFRFRFAWDNATRSARMELDAMDAEQLLRERIRDYYATNPGASANEIHKAIGGRRKDVLDLVRELDPSATLEGGSHA